MLRKEAMERARQKPSEKQKEEKVKKEIRRLSKFF